MSSHIRCADLVSLLASRAERDGDLTIYTVTTDGRSSEASMSCATLYLRARAIAGWLQRRGVTDGARVILPSPSTLEAIAAFWGIVCAGAIAVPVPALRGKHLRRLDGIIRSCRPASIVVLEGERPPAEGHGLAIAPDDLIALRPSQVGDDEAAAWTRPALAGDSVAFLQYTSGSTGAPKGVIVSHANVMANAQRQEDAFGLGPGTTCVSWLPLYHDMGLVGGTLQSMFSGYATVFMTPAAFVERPMRWMDAISAHRATVSGGPNVGYELAARALASAGPAESAASGVHHLDLSSWTAAFCGAEPVREETLRRFAAAARPFRFEPSALRPCYGLAEATLLVSAGRWSEREGDVSPERSAPHAGAQAGSHVGSRVRLGAAGAGLSMLIVDPSTRSCVPDGESGEVWLAGDGIAQGYWGDGDATRETFGACLADGARADGTNGTPTTPTAPATYLRTGDLGVMRGGELCILDRMKDLLILRGVNHYAHDVEAVVEGAHPLIRTHGVAAIGPSIDGEERLVAVVEVERGFHVEHADEVRARVQQRLAEELQLTAHRVVLVKPGVIPRTSSGKIRRRPCRDAWIANELPELAAPARHRVGDDAEAYAGSGAGAAGALVPEAGVRRILAAALQTRPDDLPLDQTVGSLGIDSLRIFQAKAALEALIGAALSYATLLDTTVGDLIVLVNAAAAAPAAGRTQARDVRGAGDARSGRADSTETYPLSVGQRALVYLHELRPDAHAYTIARAVRIAGSLNVAAFAAAFASLGQRHPELRITVTGEADAPMQRVDGALACDIRDAGGWDDGAIRQEVHALSRLPFDLRAGPLVTAHLLRRSDREHVLLFRAHHLAVDLWSLALLLDELEASYRHHKAGEPAPVTAPAFTYRDFVSWQHAFVDGDAGKRLADDWHARLADRLDVLTLPLPTPEREAEREAEHAGRQIFRIDSLTAQALQRIGREHGATLSTVIIAAVQILLARYSGQRRFLMGTLASGRTRPEHAGVIGYCVNLLPLRADVRGDMTFAALLDDVRTELSTALDRQDLPFSTIVERVRPQRTGDRSPLIRAVCVCQPASIGSARDLAALVVNQSGGRVPFGDLSLEAMEVEEPDAQFDLSIVLAHGADGLTGALQYEASRFAPDDMAAMTAAFVTLARGIAARPDSRVGDLPLLDEAAHREKAAHWNATAREIDPTACVHDIIERQAASTPAAPALMHRSRSWTYADLMQRVGIWAAQLNEMGVGPETRVAVCLERSLELVAALLAVLRAGGAYVPLDPSHPAERRERILRASAPAVVISSRGLARETQQAMPDIALLLVDTVDAVNTVSGPATHPRRNGWPAAHQDNAAYVMFTSGSTGEPKGVVISHRNVTNLFAGMDDAVGCGPEDTLIAVTSVAFDISVVELLWTLARGARVVIADDLAMMPAVRRRAPARDLSFSLFYFADADPGQGAVRTDKYALLREGASFADRNGFAAVWTPERHFHPFGGLYPNPSLTSAALASMTSRVALRAGSVVLPLHHPIRVAEEWSVVDNLSGGRVGVAFASGWHAEDFAFDPEAYADRRAIMLDRLNTVRALWRGEEVPARSGDGREHRVRLFPRPLQPELPIWLTAAGTPDTFALAARIEANVLTHLLGQTLEAVQEKVALYARTLAEQQLDARTFDVTMMLHAYVDETHAKVVAQALGPFKQYLRSSLDLVGRLVKALELDLDLDRLTPADLDDLIDFAARRYMNTSGLVGTPHQCLEMLERLVDAGVTEVACLVDFGVERAAALSSLERIVRLRERFTAGRAAASYSIAAQAERTRATMMQCTPSTLSMVLDESMKRGLAAMRAVMLGGEPLPIGLLADLGYPRNCLNMYGPTETTVWSAVSATPVASGRVTIGGPLANTQLHVLDARTMPLPEAVTGEVWIGGAGVARGYWGDPALTAQRFLPDPWSGEPGSRLYRTGDVGRRLRDGSIELLGRADQQVKLRGYRVELGDVEAAFNAIAGVRTAVVVKHEDVHRGGELVAYVVPGDPRHCDVEAIRSAARAVLPPYMVPGAIVPLDRLPVTANNKVDRKRLARLPVAPLPAAAARTPVEPRTEWEARVRRIWQDVLGIEALSLHDNFFEVGGHSLLIARVHEKLQRELGTPFPLLVLLERPTIAGIAAYLEDGLATTPTDARTRAASQRRAWQAHQRLAAAAARDITHERA